ncbi:MAG: TIGR04552 family protein [Bdellovibrionales bacterium]
MKRYHFPKEVFLSILEGHSIVDVPRLNISSIKQAHRFIKAYGYDLDVEPQRAEAWLIYDQAMDMLHSYILEKNEVLPEVLLDRDKLEDLGHLCVFASTQDGNDLQKWSCRLLRLMHVIAHLENDPFHSFSEEIQAQVLGPIHDLLYTMDSGIVELGDDDCFEVIELEKFEVKQFKSTESAGLKLLAKRSEMALRLMDRIGIRFVTKNLFDSFRVLRFLVREYVISVPNIVPDQAKNTLYPFNLFYDVMNEVDKSKTRLEDAEIAQLMRQRLEEEQGQIRYKIKENEFSGVDYRVIKFIARSRIHIKLGDKSFRFFFPYEIQIMDKDTFDRLQAGPSQHSQYKSRQAQGAKDRVLGEFEVDVF